MPLREKEPHKQGENRGAPLLKSIILPLLARLTWKWLLIVTSTGNELLRNVNIDDLEW